MVHQAVLRNRNRRNCNLLTHKNQNRILALGSDSGSYPISFTVDTYKQKELVPSEQKASDGTPGWCMYEAVQRRKKKKQGQRREFLI